MSFSEYKEKYMKPKHWTNLTNLKTSSMRSKLVIFCISQKISAETWKNEGSFYKNEKITRYLFKRIPSEFQLTLKESIFLGHHCNKNMEFMRICS